MSRHQRRRKTQQLIGLAVLFGLFLLGLFFFRGSVGRVFGVIQIPFVSAGTWINTQIGGYFEPGRLSHEERQSLEEQRNAFAIDAAELEQVKAENRQLREQLQFVERRALRVASGHIIGRHHSKQSNTVLIDLGEKDGVVVGAPVIVGSGIFVGKVSHVSGGIATVTGVSDLSMATAASLLNETRTLGIAEGATGNLISLRFIPHEETVSVNDLIVTSGLEELIPSGLLIGVVTSVNSNPTDPFQEAVAEPLADLDQYSLVSVILPTAL